MKKQDFKNFVKQIQKDIKEINDFDKLCEKYNGYNDDGTLFDFEHENYTFTISTNEQGKIYLVDNVDVWHTNPLKNTYIGNYDFKIEE